MSLTLLYADLYIDWLHGLPAMTGMDAPRTPRSQSARLQQFTSVTASCAMIDMGSYMLSERRNRPYTVEDAAQPAISGEHVCRSCHTRFWRGQTCFVPLTLLDRYLSKQICIGMFEFDAYLSFWYIRSCLLSTGNIVHIYSFAISMCTVCMSLVMLNSSSLFQKYKLSIAVRPGVTNIKHVCIARWRPRTSMLLECSLCIQMLVVLCVCKVTTISVAFAVVSVSGHRVIGHHVLSCSARANCTSPHGCMQWMYTSTHKHIVV